MNNDFIYDEQKQIIKMWKDKYYEQKQELKVTHKELCKVWEERAILYRRIYKAVDNLETPYSRGCERQCKEVIDILQGRDKE